MSDVSVGTISWKCISVWPGCTAAWLQLYHLSDSMWAACAGEGRVHQCLRDNFQKLTDGCRKEELKLNIIQSRDVRLRPKLNKACSEEIAVYCKDVEKGIFLSYTFIVQPHPTTAEDCAASARSSQLRYGTVSHLGLSANVVSFTGACLLGLAEAERVWVWCAGKGRMFKCLQESLAQPDFGQACRAQVEERGQRMQEDYRLDYGVAEACEPDVTTYCAAEKVRLHALQTHPSTACHD